MASAVTEPGAPLVSVIVSSYNYARYLGEAIESALAQTYTSREVIVVDDDSTDESMGVIERFGDRVRCYRQSNQGVSAAGNRGAREARGELFAFLDSDDAWLPEKLERQVPLYPLCRLCSEQSTCGGSGVPATPSGVRLRAAAVAIRREHGLEG